MPKFTDQEKAIIHKKLLIVGEKLFASMGLKKVTIDNLSHAAGISHSAFYSFYESKEQLFMEINMNKQQAIYERLDTLMLENSSLPAKELAKLYLISLQKAFFSDPIISSMNSDLIDYISRKVPPTLMQQINLIDQQALVKFTQAGITFNYPIVHVVEAIQSVFVGMACLEGSENKEQIIEILVDALIEKLIK